MHGQGVVDPRLEAAHISHMVALTHAVCSKLCVSSGVLHGIFVSHMRTNLKYEFTLSERWVRDWMRELGYKYRRPAGTVKEERTEIQMASDRYLLAMKMQFLMDLYHIERDVDLYGR